jgi:hypothetical protein
VSVSFKPHQVLSDYGKGDLFEKVYDGCLHFGNQRRFKNFEVVLERRSLSIIQAKEIYLC